MRLPSTASFSPRIQRAACARRSNLHTIESRTGEVFPALFRELSCPVIAREAEQTFGEKTTVLHAEYHRPADKPLPVGMSRHYSDLAVLSRHAAGQRAVTDLDLLARMRARKRTCFRSDGALHETAVPGSSHLVPSPERRALIEQDYRGMVDLFMTTPPPFAIIIAELSDWERRINARQISSR